MKCKLPRFQVFLFIMLIITSVVSCGYKPTEDDKHPDLPEFPQLNNTSFSVTKFPHENYKIIGFHHNLLFVQYDIPHTTGSNNSGIRMFATLDGEYEEVASFPLEVYALESDKYGNLYEITEDSLIKYNYPNFKRQVIEKFPDGSSTIWRDFADTIDFLMDRDPNFEVREFAGKELKKRILNFNPDSKKSYIQLENGIILFVDGKEYYEPDHLGMDGSFMEKMDDFDPYAHDSDTIQNRKLIFFDDAGLKTESYGNHYTFGFYQSGLDYFHLVMEGDSTSFKHPNMNVGGGGSLLEVGAFDRPDEVLLVNENGDLFLVEHK